VGLFFVTDHKGFGRRRTDRAGQGECAVIHWR
jgi:hypothetical protein